MQLRLNLFFKELVLFSTTMVVGLIVAYRYLVTDSASPIMQTPSLSGFDWIFFVGLVIFILFIMRFSRLAGVVLWIFLILIMFGGSQVVFGSFLSFPWDMAASLAILALFFLWRNVFMHDVGIILALAGIGGVLGISITPNFGIIVLVVLSFYDIIAVYKTKHMVKMAQGMVRSGAIFGFIIPQENRSFFENRKQAKEQIGEQFMILGSGDIGLPVIFASSLIRQSLGEAIVVALFATIGVFLTHLLFTNQHKRQAMAALPPIATMCLIGYVVALLLKF